MSANTLLTSVVTGGSNSHATVAEEANSYATDFVTQGVVGAITLNSGSGGTGAFCVNADASPDMGVTIKAGQAYVTATPSGQNSQVLRVRAAADYTAYTINANASGSTKYDWVYLSISATNANTPSAAADNVASFVTSRSSSNTVDTGSPPTYGLHLAIVTVANAASSITNSVITDKRFNTSIGAQNGSLIVTQSGTGTDAIIQAAGIDANVNLQLAPKGTGKLSFGTAGLSGGVTTYTNAGSAGGTSTFFYTNLGGIKLFWGRTASIAVSGTGFQSTTRTLTLPTSFFSTIQQIQLTVDAPTATQYLSAGVSSSSASTMDINLNQSNGSNGSAAINVLVIGT